MHFSTFVFQKTYPDVSPHGLFIFEWLKVESEAEGQRLCVKRWLTATHTPVFPWTRCFKAKKISRIMECGKGLGNNNNSGHFSRRPVGSRLCFCWPATHTIDFYWSWTLHFDGNCFTSLFGDCLKLFVYSFFKSPFLDSKQNVFNRSWSFMECRTMGLASSTPRR